jgi:hypothetical protein
MLQTGQPWGLPLPAGPIRVLVVISSPFPPENSLMYVDTQVESAQVSRVLDQFSGQVEYEILSGPLRAQDIATRLRQGDGFDVLHFIGHGDWREAEQTGYLILSGDYADGSSGPLGVSSAELIQLISTSPRLPQMFILAACQSGQQSSLDAFAGVGPQLVAAGCPAVICMQEKVEADIARRFSEGFYTTLLETGCVDLSANSARANLLDNRYAQWSVPVLYMHLVDGIFFDPGIRFRPAQRQPYPFLAPYQRENADLFKGRTSKIQEIYHLICDHPVTVLYGEPGVGVTSLLEAGIRPMLEDKGWLVVSVSEYSDLASEFRVQLRLDGRPLTLKAAGDAPLADLLRAISPARFQQVAILLDQFEGVFEFPEEGRQAVQRQLLDSLSTLGDRLRLVLALHKEYVPNLASLQGLLEGRAGTWKEIFPLEVDSAVEAIIGPLDTLGWPVSLTPALAGQIAPDLSSLYADYDQRGGTWVDPGQLQITCTWLYSRARERRPPLIDEILYLREAGGAEGILVRYMEEELKTRFADRFDLARQVLVTMAAPDMEHWSEAEQIRQRIGDAAEMVAPLLDRLVRAELLTRRVVGGKHVYAFSNRTIAEEASRLGGESTRQAYHAGDELQRAWRLWLAELVQVPPGSRTADRALPGRQQLRVLAENTAHLDARPAQLLMLLRAAVLRDEPVRPWLDCLQKEEARAPFVISIEGIQPAKGGSAREMASRLLGLENPDRPKPPSGASGFGDLAWTAVSSPDVVDRGAAVLTMAALPESVNPGTRLDKALKSLGTGISGLFRRAEVFGRLEDAGFDPDKLPHKNTRTRMGVYLWRASRRIFTNRQSILWLSLGAAIGGGLGLGLERLIVGWLAQSPFGMTFLALFSYWGFFLAGLTGLSVELVNRMLLNPDPSWRFRPGMLRVLAGTLGFFLANLVVAILNGISITNHPLSILMGLIAGLGLGAALAGDEPLVATRRFLRWLFPASLAALAFALAQSIFLVNPGAGSGYSISLSSGFFAVEYEHFSSALWQDWVRSFPDWGSLLSLLETALAGFALSMGALAGRSLAARLDQRFKDVMTRLGE